MAVWWRVNDGACANNRGSARSELTPHLAGEADTAISGLAEPRSIFFGEDVGYFGGVFRCTDGLQRKYGKSRCFDAPINELGIVAVAIGMGAYGLAGGR